MLDIFRDTVSYLIATFIFNWDVHIQNNVTLTTFCPIWFPCTQKVRPGIMIDISFPKYIFTSWNTRRCSGFKKKWKNSSDMFVAVSWIVATPSLVWIG
jgi:hypothetical protein